MKKMCVSLISAIVLVLGMNLQASAQLSANTVKYRLTFDEARQLYTVWLHPNYGTPNAHNDNDHEFSYTAQVSLKVSRDFTLSDVQDIRGIWTKNPRKTGDPSIEKDLAFEKYDASARYYAIGKAPIYDDFGKFTPGDSVALFSFRGETGGQVEILGPQDPYITAAANATALNFACSFYSRSGQPRSMTATPMEQFIDRKPSVILNQKPSLSMPIALKEQLDDQVTDLTNKNLKNVSKAKKIILAGED